MSSPASSIVSTLPWTSLGVIPDCGSSAATIIASSRFFGAARRAGSSSRSRAAATKPWIAAATAATLRSSSRSAADFHQRQVGSGGEHAPKDGREDLVEVLLDDVGVRLERVDLGAEGEPGDGVDGVAHQVGLQVDRRAGVGGAAPAPGEALADGRRATGSRRADGADRSPPSPSGAAASTPRLRRRTRRPPSRSRPRSRPASWCGESRRAGRAGARPSPGGRRSPGCAGCRAGSGSTARTPAPSARPADGCGRDRPGAGCRRAAGPAAPAGRRSRAGARASPRAAVSVSSGHAQLPDQCFVGADTLCRISRPCSRSQSRFFSVLRLSCSALPLASAISALTRPPL